MSNVAELFVTEAQPDRFDEFWKAYPHCKRVKKPLARAKFEAITGPGLKTKTYDKDSNSYAAIELKATAEEIIEGVKRYADRNKATGSGSYGFIDGGKYICHPSVFLNQGRWMDD